jgi:hypothetical protein
MRYLLLVIIALLTISCSTESISENEADITFTVLNDSATITDYGFEYTVIVDEIHKTNIEFIVTSINQYSILLYSDTKIKGSMRGIVKETNDKYMLVKSF